MLNSNKSMLLPSIVLFSIKTWIGKVLKTTQSSNIKYLLLMIVPQFQRSQEELLLRTKIASYMYIICANGLIW
jgi:hypothetical protein